MSYNKMGSYLYSRLPHYHKVVDEQERLLQRFMEVLNVGFDINDHNLKLALEKTQASKCGEDYLEELAKSMGADWIRTIDPSYQRTIIRMLIQLYKKKGTIDTIRFIASELSGFEATVIEGEIPNEYFQPGDEKKRLLTIRLQAPELDDPISAQQHESTISEVISQFVPVHTKYVLLVTYFYDESYYRRMMESDVLHVTEQIQTQHKAFRSDYDIIDITKQLYSTDSSFNMIGHTGNVGELNNPNFLLTNNFKTSCGIEYEKIVYTKIRLDYVQTHFVPNEDADVSVLNQNLGSYEIEAKYVEDTSSSVVLKYNEEVKIPNLGIHKKLLCTTRPSNLITSKEYQLTNFSYLDSITTKDGQYFIYE